MRKKITFILLTLIISISITACSNNSKKNQEEDMSLYIEKISLSDIENNVAYWDVFFTDDTNWSDDDLFKENLALYSIKQCLSKDASQSALSCSIMGYETDGSIAFSYGGIDGTDEIRYYKGGKHTHNSKLTESQYNFIGFLPESDSDKNLPTKYPELEQALISEFNNSNITELTVDDYDTQRYMLCLTIDLEYFENSASPEEIRDFINEAKQIANKHSNKFFQYYITIVENGMETNFCSWPTGDENQERFVIKYYKDGEVTDSIVYYLSNAEKVYKE